MSKKEKERFVRRYYRWVEYYKLTHESIDALYSALQQQMYIAGSFGYLHRWVKVFGSNERATLLE